MPCFCISAKPKVSGFHIQPLGGGLLAIVPAPRGILAVGEGTVGDLVVADLGGEAGVRGEASVADEAGDTGFILRPLIGVPFGGGGWVAGGGPGSVDRGVGGSILSRCACR